MNSTSFFVPDSSLGKSIRQSLKEMAKKRNRPFDEILRYYAMERFLYRLSISAYAEKFFLKGGLILKYGIQWITVQPWTLICLVEHQIKLKIYVL